MVRARSSDFAFIVLLAACGGSTVETFPGEASSNTSRKMQIAGASTIAATTRSAMWCAK
jgi:hypothetical protein